ncbi:hypothetical protein CP965_11865 [Halarcobacter mediterraneus]|uniref:Chemotaxis protein n=1 Tax=Halarcobacter mediterraneus TaxID=2023153 RepID=A0A4Q1AQU8_9BACT|nr:hypothetical protein [Halarcobacter mediterraneus]RXK11871.1 hypothetical protein CP965_11865 [Halarcobacter mediterraneus]
MSMSQEEIESLMNGLDFGEDSSKEESSEENSNEKVEETPQKSMSEDDINDLISETEDIINDKDSSEEESIDDIVNSFEKEEVQNESQEEVQEKNEEEPSFEEDEKSVDEILNQIESIPTENIEEEPTLVNESNSEPTESNIDDILASIEGIEETSVETTEDSTPIVANEEIQNSEEDLDHKINSGVFPLPVEQDTKVVNQLSQVANDSEEKATKIFDVLSNILDYNNNIQNDVKELASFNEKQTAMLTSLNNKFPNIEAFKQNLEQAQKMGNFISDINGKLENGNMEIFQAMELMQYHDINRQKIERVMSVIRKLSVYLNNLFEDEGQHDEIAVAKHIHGDSSTGDLVGDDDLEALIAEFNK